MSNPQDSDSPALNRSAEFFSFEFRPWGIISAAGYVGCVATVLGFLGCLSWFLDLFSHFRVQYFCGLSLIACLLLFPKKFKHAGVLSIFAVVNLATIAPLYWPPMENPSGSSSKMRAMLMNVNTREGDVESVRNAILKFEPDLIVLEEVNRQWISDLSAVTGAYRHSLVQPRSDNFGIALYANLTVAGSEIIYLGDADVPSIAASIRAPAGEFTVIASHPLPPGGPRYSQLRNDQLSQLAEYIQDVTSPVLLLGDLNVSPWSCHYKRLLNLTGLQDSSKGRGVQPTWPANNPLLLIPIDHCLHSQKIAIIDKQIGPDVGSDHYPVIVDFALYR